MMRRGVWSSASQQAARVVLGKRVSIAGGLSPVGIISSVVSRADFISVVGGFKYDRSERCCSQRRLFRTSGTQCKVEEFLLADIGEGIAEVEIMQWFVKEGDKISQFDKVCEVQSDKATVEITSRYDGVVKSVNYQVGAMAAVGSSLITLDVENRKEEIRR